VSHRLVTLLLVSSALLTACGSSGPPRAATGYRLFLEEGLDNAGARITVRQSGSSEMERVLPAGTPAQDWSRYYTITHLNGSSQLAALEPASGRTLAQREVPAGYALPGLGFQGPSIGLSPNGRWIALAGSKTVAEGKSYTSFLVGASSLDQSFKALRVPGDMMFDALSNDGRHLYLVETMGEQGHYRVRLYDVASQSLAAQPVVDKREPAEPMNGIRGDSLPAAAANYVFTVYARNEGPFIHALPLDQPVAWCIDLPTTHAGNWDEQFQWSLVTNSDDSRLYAVNPASGLIAEMSTRNLPKVNRTAQVALNSKSGGEGGVLTAEAKGLAIGGAAVSSDGRTLFALGSTGIVAIDTQSLKMRARYLDGEDIVSIRLSGDGKWLYAADSGANKILQINPQTGALAGEVTGVDHPWAVLFAQPE
jgi:hypothetical protein